MKTISLLPEPKDQTVYLLQPPFFENKPCSVGSNTRPKTLVRPTFHSPGKSLKPFFVRAWEDHELLLIVSGGLLEKTPSISMKKSWIEQLTSSTCRPCSENLTPLSSQMKKFWFATFVTAWDLPSEPKQMSEVETWILGRKLSKKPLMLRLKQLVSLSHWWEKWIINVLEAITLSNLMSLPKSQRTLIRMVLGLKSQKPKLLNVPIMLRPSRRLGKRRRTTAGTKVAIEPHKIKNHKKAPPQPLESTTTAPLGMEIHKRTRTETVDRIQPRLSAEIATKRATMQTNIRNF